MEYVVKLDSNRKGVMPRNGYSALPPAAYLLSLDNCQVSFKGLESGVHDHKSDSGGLRKAKGNMLARHFCATLNSAEFPGSLRTV